MQNLASTYLPITNKLGILKIVLTQNQLANSKSTKIQNRERNICQAQKRKHANENRLGIIFHIFA